MERASLPIRDSYALSPSLCRLLTLEKMALSNYRSKCLVIPTIKLMNVILTSYFSFFDGATATIAGAMGILKIYEPFNCVDQKDNHVQMMT